MIEGDHLKALASFLLAKNILVAVAKTSSEVILPLRLWSKTLAKDESS